MYLEGSVGGYIAKSKPEGVCLQLTQTPGGDYVIWPKINYSIFEGNDMDHWYITKDIILKVLYYTQTKKLFTYQKTNHDNLLFLCFWSLLLDIL